MNINLETTLEQLGLTDNQIKIYLALLQTGESTIQEVMAKTKIKRTTIYKSLDNLVARGLVTFQDQGWHRKYFAENPKKAILSIREEKRKVDEKEKKFFEIMPELVSIYNSMPAKPKIRFYEGIDGLKQATEETLLMPKGSEIVAFTGASFIYKTYDEFWIKDYLARRVKGKIFERCIAENSPESKKHKSNDKEEFRETRLIPKDKFLFKNEINIYGNKVSIVSFREQMGIIIESQDVADTWRAIFELAWLGAEKYDKKKSAIR